MAAFVDGKGKVRRPELFHFVDIRFAESFSGMTLPEKSKLIIAAIDFGDYVQGVPASY